MQNLYKDHFLPSEFLIKFKNEQTRPKLSYNIYLFAFSLFRSAFLKMVDHELLYKQKRDE